MATARIHGLNINYEIIGDEGPTVTLTTGGFSVRRRIAMSTALWGVRKMVTGVGVVCFMAMLLCFSPLAAQTKPKPEWG